MNILFNGQTTSVDDPNICPHCHVTNNPHLIYQESTKDTDDSFANISFWKCSNAKCSKLFVALYKIPNDRIELCRFLNGIPKGPDWPTPISALKSGNSEIGESSKFIKTYLQSLQAEQNGLDELAGMGYRKAIEYLVKDWAIQDKSSDKDKIKNSWLGSVVSDYFTGDLKDILERATWLGNDQTHYNRLFEEFDLDVLKELINLIMVELDRQYKMAHYKDLIKNKK